MQKRNKKGFTLVELVIVIAVIAILAGVLIGTFATVIENANKSKAMQETKNAFTEYLTEIDYTKDSAKAVNSYVIQNGKYYFAVKEGQFIAVTYINVADAVSAATPTNVTLTSTDLQTSTPAKEATETYYFVKVGTTDYYEYTVVPKQ